MTDEIDLELDVQSVTICPGSRYAVKVCVSVSPTDVLDHFSPAQLIEYVEKHPSGAREGESR